ncbi:MAG TPA: thiamine-phosphate kinase [Kiloniellales bacterium]|nr:thiamine-phosphate kinase [Kiloniellales bacterium]
MLTADAMVSGVHFLPDDAAGGVAQKLLRVNLSDLAAMGATPLGYLLTCAWPKDIEESWVAAFAKGLAEDQQRFDLAVLGGDMTATPGPLTLSLTALGHVTPGRALRRSGARAGDRIYVSGAIGDGALGLLVLTHRLHGISREAAEALAERYHRPTPRVALGQALSRHGLAHACLDVSDGLVADLGHIARTSKLAARVKAKRVPLSLAAREALAENLGLFPLLLTGGDDYELCFTAAPEKAPAIEALAQELALPLTDIGYMMAGEGVEVLDRDDKAIALARAGWTHF